MTYWRDSHLHHHPKNFRLIKIRVYFKKIAKFLLFNHHSLIGNSNFFLWKKIKKRSRKWSKKYFHQLPRTPKSHNHPRAWHTEGIDPYLTKQKFSEDFNSHCLLHKYITLRRQNSNLVNYPQNAFFEGKKLKISPRKW